MVCYFIFRFALVYVRGKPGRKVPILMTPETVKAVEMLIETREQIGGSKDNKYVFAAPTRGSRKFLRGPDCLSSVVEQYDLESSH